MNYGISVQNGILLIQTPADRIARGMVMIPIKSIDMIVTKRLTNNIAVEIYQNSVKTRDISYETQTLSDYTALQDLCLSILSTSS